MSNNPRDKIVTRETSKKLLASSSKLVSSDSSSEEEGELTIMEVDDREDIMQKLQEMRAQLEAVTATAAMEREERQRYQELAKQLKDTLDASATTVSTNDNTNLSATSTASVSTETFSFGTAVTNVISTVPALCATTTGFNATASTLTGPLTSSEITPIPRATYTPYTPYSCLSGIPHSMHSNQQPSASTVNITPTPTFLPSINAMQTFGQQQFHASQPTFVPNALSQQLSQSGYGNHRKLHDLPEFSGRPEEWPMFCTSFVESTNMFGYSKVENMFRLQKSIKGEAREIVESLLIHPNNVEQVMATLEFRFGRAECLVQSQLRKVREIEPIPDNKLELLVCFATKVQNLSVFLEASGMHQHMANPTLLDELVSKLPMSKRLDWAQSSMHIQPFATIKHFNDWLSQLARLVCVVTTTLPPPQTSNQCRGDAKSRTRSVLHTTNSTSAATVAVNNKCRHCEGTQHPVTECSSFLCLEPSDKWEFLKRNRLCFGCLKYGHTRRTCRLSKRCGIDGCTGKHHQLLHEEETKDAAEIQKPLLNCNDNEDKRILFRIVPVRIFNGDLMVRTFALFDEGSSVTIISSNLAKRLCLRGRAKDLSLRWFGQETVAKESTIVDFDISADLDEAEQFRLRGVQTVEGLCLPTQTIVAEEVESLRDQPTTVPLTEYADAKPEILIGLDNCQVGAPVGPVKSLGNGLLAARTKLGWVVYGQSATKVRETNQRDTPVCCTSRSDVQDVSLDRIVEDYFSIDNFGVKRPTQKPVSDIEKRALHLLSTTTVKIDNRFQTGLLWKKDALELPNSYQLAERRLLSLETKMQRDPEFATTYRDVIRSYVMKGYARKLSSEEAETETKRTWYLPHFGVRNPNKPGKIRLVFDAAAEVNGISLNSFLLKGPDNNRPLLEVLFNFRVRPVAVTGDIKEMFHQVLIQPEDQNSQRFLWREDTAEPIDTYIMKAMTFGATCSPCSANFVKNLNASRFYTDHPRAVDAIIKHHYVDDYVDSFETVSEAINVTKKVIAIHRSGGFELRNFMSNSQDVLHSILDSNTEGHSTDLVDMNIDSTVPTERVLGMCWNSVKDVFIFQVRFPRVSQTIIVNDRCPTKREFLSVAMSIYDPFGMIANFTIHLKLLLRSIWRFGTAWDEPIPEVYFQRWRQWKSQLSHLTHLTIPRCHSPALMSASRVDLHTFVDASEEAFSAVTYLRVEHNGEVYISFISGKTRAAPKKLLSIPRLELSASVLGTRLWNSIVNCHKLSFGNSVFWSDSKTVLHWLRSDPRRHKQFVAFRIAEILDSSRVSQWRWVPSKLNPADEATRAHYPPHFEVNNSWIRGPHFLKLSEAEWPRLPDDIGSYECVEELRPKYMMHASLAEGAFFDATRFSSFLKLQRTIAWVLRFIAACKRTSVDRGELSVAELNEAENLIYRQIQKEAFRDDINKLRQELPISRDSKIFKLSPYLDESGLVRVLGRIDAATTVPFSTRRPIILPKDHSVTRLLIDRFHRRFSHQNDDTVVNEIRQRFWVPSLRSSVKRTRRECQQCRIRCAKPQAPLMGQLPEDRLTPFVRAFTYTGLDYFGPVNISIGRRKEKRWIALFTCLTIRAVHLEIAADLSTDACILCIRNFVNRRGVPIRIRSDNGTNFIGAKKELVNNSIFDVEALKAELSSRGIEWKLNCPLNPHAGGSWERLVQSIKRVLSRTLCDIAPKIETLQSALIEAENIVNSRPLTHLPVSTECEEPLTPNHFLLGVPNSTQTPAPVEERALCLRKQWRVSQQLKNRFWRRWVLEYLPILTKRCKWFDKESPLQVGDLVLICDVDVPRSQWVRGRIVNVFPGPDGQVRTAEVKTATGVLRRPAVKLAVLKIGETSDRDSGASRGGRMSKNIS